jgi:hypothetical protein
VVGTTKEWQELEQLEQLELKLCAYMILIPPVVLSDKQLG